MELCGTCNGHGFTESQDVCKNCDGEGIESAPTTFVVGKMNRRKSLDYHEHQDSKKPTIDKKNGIVRE